MGNTSVNVSVVMGIAHHVNRHVTSLWDVKIINVLAGVIQVAVTHALTLLKYFVPAKLPESLCHVEERR